MNIVMREFWSLILEDMFSRKEGIRIDYTEESVCNWNDFEIAVNHYNFVKRYENYRY